MSSPDDELYGAVVRNCRDAQVQAVLAKSADFEDMIRLFRNIQSTSVRATAQEVVLTAAEECASSFAEHFATIYA